MDFVGKVFTNIENTGDALYFHCSDGEVIHMFHDQDCCDHVSIDSIVGDMEDIKNSPVVLFVVHRDGGETEYGTFTVTVFTIATAKGTVKIEWYGSSNGYYGEGVSLDVHKNG